VKQEFYETLGEVKDGKFVGLRNRRHFDEAMRRFPDGVVGVRFEVIREKRSSAQNRYWHGVVIPLFAEHCGYEFDEMKDALALELLPKEVVDMKTGEVRIVPGHTSEQNTKQFKELIERAQRLGATMGIDIPDPGEMAA
jgi:hypothetical protein